MDDLVAKAVAQALDRDDGIGSLSARSYPADRAEEDGEKRVENDDEEDRLDDRGRGAPADFLAVALTCIPWKQPAMAMIMPNTGALISAIQRSVIGMTSRIRWMKVTGGMPRSSQQKRPPPSSAMMIAQKPSSGIISTVDITRGRTSASIGETPIVRIASISSVSFIEPIWAAKAEPERPATMIAVISTPSSRTVSGR